MRARPSRNANALVLMVAVMLSTLPIALPAQAQEDGTEARLRSALREAGTRIRNAEAALAQQQLATAAVERERDALKVQATPKPAVDTGRVAALQRQLGQASDEAAQARAEQQKWQAAQQQAAQIAQQKETERAAVEQQLLQARTQATQCAANGDALYATGREIAALYRDPDFVDFARGHRRELLGFDRVKQENRVRTLEDALADQHAKAQQCRTTPAATAPAGSTG